MGISIFEKSGGMGIPRPRSRQPLDRLLANCFAPGGAIRLPVVTRRSPSGVLRGGGVGGVRQEVRGDREAVVKPARLHKHHTHHRSAEKGEWACKRFLAGRGSRWQRECTDHRVSGEYNEMANCLQKHLSKGVWPVGQFRGDFGWRIKLWLLTTRRLCPDESGPAEPQEQQSEEQQRENCLLPRPRPDPRA